MDNAGMKMSGKATKILLVEDDRFAREYILEWLKGRGYDVVQAGDGLEALKIFRKEKPDLILLDLGIPKMDGLEVLEHVRQEDSQLPVIIVSGRSDISAAIKAFTTGAWDYITKPIVSLDYLDRTIRNSLERKRLQGEIEKAEKRYHDLVENLPIIVFILQRDFRLEFINNTCTALLGYTPKEALETPDWFFEHIYPEDRGKVRSALQESFNDCSVSFAVEFRFEHKQGYLVHLLAKSIPASGSEAGECPLSLEGLIMDVTEHNFLDTVLVQNEKLNTLGAMSAELAHEIRNPLVPLAGYAKRLQEKNPDLRETGIILAEASRLEKLVDRISSYLQPVPVNRKECSVNAIVRFSMEMMSSKMKKRSVEPVLDLDQNLAIVNSDPDILTQVLVNIISSGVESVGEGGKITIKTHETRKLTSIDIRVKPLVKSLANTELLYLPFEQDMRSYSMAVSYRLMTNVGGYLSIQETENTAKYRITLPKDEISERSEVSTPAL